MSLLPSRRTVGKEPAMFRREFQNFGEHTFLYTSIPVRMIRLKRRRVTKDLIVRAPS